MNELIDYYNKFNEDKRLKRAYGRIEYLTTMKYIHDFIGEKSHLSVLDIGAASGVYAVPLTEEGHSVTAVDLVNYHVGILKQKKRKNNLGELTVKQADARDLKKIPDEAFDLVLCLGPMYHVFSDDDKLRVLNEAKKKLKPEGVLFVAYCMNEYGVLTYGFKEGKISESLRSGKLDQDYHIRNEVTDLFSFVRTEDIERYNEIAGLKRVKIVSSDGAANYLREEIKKMDEETFRIFFDYHLKTCERPDLLGAAGHLLDIVRK